MKRSALILGLALVFSVFLMAAACVKKDTLQASWDELLKKCAYGDTIGRTVYFGPSNDVGPGSIWRETKDGFNIRWLFKHFMANASGADDFIKKGQLSSCQGVRETFTKVGSNLTLESKLAPVSGGLGVDYKRAKKISVSVGGWAWDHLIEGPFDKAVQSLEANNDYKNDMAKPDRVVLVKALRVSGMIVDLEFSQDVATELKPKYAGKIAKLGIGQVALEVGTSWLNNTTLRVRSESDFYLAGEFAKYYLDSGFAGSSGAFSKITPNPEAKVGTDETFSAKY